MGKWFCKSCYESVDTTKKEEHINSEIHKELYDRYNFDKYVSEEAEGILYQYENGYITFDEFRQLKREMRNYYSNLWEKGYFGSYKWIYQS